MTRSKCLGLAIIVAIAGLALRLGPWTLPLWAHHFGGGFLWGAMIFLLAAAVRPDVFGPVTTIVAASVVVVGIELFRLYHSPGLDAFRLTLPGQLLLGRIFSGWNILVDEAGLLSAAIVNHTLRGRDDTRTQ